MPLPTPKDPDPLRRLIQIMACLRDPERGCPWDREQDFSSIAPFTIEEAYEVADAIERQDMPSLKEELGDLLLQVVYHARMAEEESCFAFDDVAEAIGDKMVRRHPHVFDGQEVADAAAQTLNWEELKAAERAARSSRRQQPASLLDDVPKALPALMRAEKLQKRAARVGFDWPEVAQVLDKIEEELGEVREALAEGDKAALEDEIGDLIFAVANLARHCGLGPEEALRSTNRKFEKRFKAVEAAFNHRLEGVSLDAMEAAWQAAKSLK